MTEVTGELLSAAVGGDAESMGVLLRRYGPEVRRRLHVDARWQGLFDAADVMQVTYLEAFLHVGQLAAHTEEGFIAWLTQIAQHNLQDAIRELERQKRPGPRRQVRWAAPDDSASTLLHALCDSTATTPGRAVARHEWQQFLEVALAQLPPTYAAVVRLHDLEGRSIAKVAETLGRSPGAVYMLRARALERLQELLGSASRFLSGGA